MFPADLIRAAEVLSERLRSAGLVLATAESCTGGLIAGLLTELPGSSDILDRGFVTYSNEAKHEMIGVPADMIGQYGAVSREIAEAMAHGAIAHSNGTVSVAVTGVAGPGGGTADKPVGLVHIAAVHGTVLKHRECRFGDTDRQKIRLDTIAVALELVEEVI
ncbi:MAG: CinA family protein [Hyphomicrobiaceae bacterium]